MYKVFWLILVSVNAIAVPVSINIENNKNGPVFQAVVYLQSMTETQNEQAIEDVAVMDQIDRQFIPHILAVQKGTNVIFPNSDSIKHHVYSFSAAKQFELKLYSDSKTEPLLFDNSGEVELGCNVHDWMLGYIWVVDTPYFAKTTQAGNTVIDVPEGEYKLKVWHPRIQDDLDALSQTITVKDSANITIQLKQDLLQDLSFYEQQTDTLTDY